MEFQADLLFYYVCFLHSIRYEAILNVLTMV